MIHSSRSARKRQGFTLVELSIVLVILGLLVGGVLTGQSLIRAAELRSVSTEYSRYITAMQTFRDKYFALPGDMPNATAYWGKDNSNCSSDTGAAATPGTCNGDGSGVIDAYNALPSREQLHFWQQLSLAGLIEGNYTGLGTASAGSSLLAVGVPGTNIPKSKAANNGGWTTFYLLEGASEVGNFSDLPANSYQFMLMAGYNSGYWANDATVLKPEDVYNIDMKMDDGRPATGTVRGGSNQNNCLIGTTSAATYNFVNTNKACLIAFKML